MSYQALYRKYRPQTFSDVVGQEHITETLKNELSAGKVSACVSVYGNARNGQDVYRQNFGKGGQLPESQKRRPLP